MLPDTQSPISVRPERFETILEALRYWATARPEALAVDTHDHGRLNYADLLDQAEALAAGFLSLGLKAGDRVAIQIPSSPEFVTAYFACQISGCVLTTYHMPYRQEELRPLVSFSRPKAVLTSQVGKYNGPETMALLASETGTMDHIIVVGGEASEGEVSFHMLINENRGKPLPPVPPVKSELALCFTSGTSAAPKAVLRTQDIITENAHIFSEMLSMTEDDRIMIAPPLTHVFGLSCAGNAIYSGAAIVPIPLFSPKIYAHYLTEMAPTVVYSAPAHLAATLKSGAMENKPPVTVRDVIVGGSICPPKVAEAFEAHLPNGRVGSLFGMTEMALATQTDPNDPPAIRHGTVGKLAKGLKIRVMSREGMELPAGEEGEMQLSGYSVLSEYHDNPGANESAFTDDGWFRTGDLAMLDEEGNIMITGRSKDIINRGSIKINPSDIESLVDAHPSVIQSALVPMPDPVLGERICAYAVLKPGESLNLPQLCAFLESKHIGKMRWPERLEILDEMPMTPTRKIIKPVLVADIRKKLEDEEA
ncbi:class I adenylate-forming enzyme family protein [Celeribacter halophilus]|uniref:class I adenylate-forming enzyme family protein n=1 Tax=Celeribacter halophilus TaxID=576117 RepID=UPI001C0A55A7|nr:class I adenylate-forming enzyme family protein [Celeribacter halophilus]MBU2891379.1 acyl--CoA ligase [Celeribacter halophilus]MDO6512395.1 class I adenylate-forming enzyme family protein [Celeribacter halophilus]